MAVCCGRNTGKPLQLVHTYFTQRLLETFLSQSGEKAFISYCRLEGFHHGKQDNVHKIEAELIQRCHCRLFHLLRVWWLMGWISRWAQELWDDSVSLHFHGCYNKSRKFAKLPSSHLFFILKVTFWAFFSSCSPDDNDKKICDSNIPIGSFMNSLSRAALWSLSKYTPTSSVKALRTF